MEIASAFSNLITNAIKYTPKGGIITIGWHDDGEHGYFTVQDNGIGIDPKHLPRLTERFTVLTAPAAVPQAERVLGWPSLNMC